MQKQTFEKIDKMEARINRIEKIIVGGIGCNIYSCTFQSYVVLTTYEVT